MWLRAFCAAMMRVVVFCSSVFLAIARRKILVLFAPLCRGAVPIRTNGVEYNALIAAVVVDGVSRLVDQLCCLFPHRIHRFIALGPQDLFVGPSEPSANDYLASIMCFGRLCSPAPYSCSTMKEKRFGELVTP